METSVNLDGDQDGISAGSTSVVANVPGNETLFTALEANPLRVKAIIFNDTSKDLLVKYGAAVGEDDWTERLEQDDSLVIASYKGIVTVKNINLGGPPSGKVRITDITP